MALEPVPTVTGRAIFIPGADIDTDRIIPARFMKCVTFDGLGEFAFYDVRFDEHGVKTKHPASMASSPSHSPKFFTETPPHWRCLA
jgi:3-isopropylmalate/(R)-2-methylmalate dehydratase small subunit